MSSILAPPTIVIAVIDYGLAKGKGRFAYQGEQTICEIEKNEEKIAVQKKFIAESLTGEQPTFKKIDQIILESSEKDKLIEKLKTENEKLKVELAQAQLLLMENEGTACVPSETCATVHVPDNTGNSAHSQIRGNGDFPDKVEGGLVSQGEEKMGPLALDTSISGDRLDKEDTTSYLFANPKFFMRVGQAIDRYFESVTNEQYLYDLCKAAYPENSAICDELLEEIRKL